MSRSARARIPSSDERCRSDRCASTKSASDDASEVRRSASFASIVSATVPMRLVYDARAAPPRPLQNIEGSARSTSTTTWWQWCWGTAPYACGASRRPSASNASCASRASACGANGLDALPPTSHVLVLRGDCPVRRPRAPRPRQNPAGGCWKWMSTGDPSPVARTCARIRSQRSPPGWRVDRGRLSRRTSPP